ncbi:hypothetical protein PVAP13_3KG163327, partial [Panicum virgatum]
IGTKSEQARPVPNSDATPAGSRIPVAVAVAVAVCIRTRWRRRRPALSSSCESAGEDTADDAGSEAAGQPPARRAIDLIDVRPGEEAACSWSRRVSVSTSLRLQPASWW